MLFHHSLLISFIFFIHVSSVESSNFAFRTVKRTARHVQGFTKDLNVALGTVVSRQQSQVRLTSNSQAVICKAEASSGVGTSSGGNTTSSSGSGSGSGSGSSISSGSGTQTASAASGSSTGTAVTTPWKLVEQHSGSNFFDGWTFTNAADVTTHGLANYVDENTAFANNLTQITSDGTAIMRVETTATVSGNRQSIRITTDSSYNSGLWILDALHMPTGCGTWPAFWTNGPNWPAGGEIDIVEGISDSIANQATLHTEAGCTLSSTSSSALDITGSVVTGTDCVAVNGGTGCGIRSDSDVSFGSAFNGNGGGVFIMSLNSSGIAVWFFERSAIPSDVTAGTPLPALWGAPFAWWSSSSCDIGKFFGFQSTIFDTTLCGDLAGSAWTSSGGPGQATSCAARTGVSDCDTFVRQNGASFEQAYWEILSVKIYQIPS